MTLVMDDWSAFMHAYDDELVAGLTVFYDVWPYEHHRRGKDIRIKIPRPQLNVIAGSTPKDLMKFMPENAWGQGFTSRVILVFSDHRTIGDDFALVKREIPSDLLYDLKLIYSLNGEFKVSEEFRKLVSDWRQQDENPKPSHPKLLHYNTRRRAHLYKLAMVSSVNRGNGLDLLGDDFKCALAWLAEAELNMPRIFEEGSTSVDARAMDEICDWIRRQEKPVFQHAIIRFASTLVPAHAVMKVLEIMSLSGRIGKVGEAKGHGLYVANPEPHS